MIKHILYDLGGLNKSAFIILNNITNNCSLLPYILKYIGSIFWIWNYFIYLPIVFLIIIYASYKQRQPDRFYYQYSTWLSKFACAWAIVGLIYAFLKFSINMPRPFCSLLVEEFISIQDFTGERCLSSFPSAHSAMALISFYYLRQLWAYKRFAYTLDIIGASLVILVGLSRVTLAMHYPVDILYSYLIAAGVIIVSRVIFDKVASKLSEPIVKFIYQSLRR